MKTTSQLLFTLLLSAIALTLAFALMLLCNTSPATAFAYLLVFITLRSITILTVTREHLLQFAIASILCLAAAFWTLRSNTPLTWDRHDASPYSIAWRSAIILLCLLAIPHYASFLAHRCIKRFRRPVI